MHVSEEVALQDTQNARLRAWKLEALEICEPCQATEYQEVLRAARTTLGNLDTHVFAAEGLGVPNRGQYRPTGEKAKVFFKIPDAEGVRKACRLRVGPVPAANEPPKRKRDNEAQPSKWARALAAPAPANPMELSPGTPSRP